MGKPLRFQRALALAYTACVAGTLAWHVRHCVWVTREAYSSNSLVLAARSGQGERILFDDFREAYGWLAHNTAPSAKVRGASAARSRSSQVRLARNPGRVLMDSSRIDSDSGESRILIGGRNSNIEKQSWIDPG